MMDSGTLTILITAASGIIGTLASTIAVLYRGKTAAEKLWGETWKSLYDAEKIDHAKTRADSAIAATANAQVLRELADSHKELVEFIRHLPRRQEDEEPTTGRRPRA